jgi:hypothetical protein
VNTPNFGLWYPKGASFDLVGYSDSDWARDKVERKSSSGACQFLGRSLVCWSSKKQNYGVIFDKVPLLCDSESAIKIAHNPVQHNKMKHIEIRHHFIRDHVNHGEIDLSYVGTNEQPVDIFTKPLDEARFRELRHELNIIDSSNVA